MNGAPSAVRRPTGPVRDDGVYLFLDGLQDPGNVGALARVAEANGQVFLNNISLGIYPERQKILVVKAAIRWASAAAAN